MIPAGLWLYRLSRGCWRISGTWNEAVTGGGCTFDSALYSRQGAQAQGTACQLSLGTRIHTVVIPYLPLLTVRENLPSHRKAGKHLDQVVVPFECLNHKAARAGVICSIPELKLLLLCLHLKLFSTGHATERSS